MKKVLVRVLGFAGFFVIAWLAYMAVGIYLMPASPTLVPQTTPSMSLVNLQPTVIVQLISPSQKEMKVQQISKEIYSDMENKLTFVLIDNGIRSSHTITQTTDIGSVSFVTKGFMVVPSDWYFEYQRPIEVGESVEFFNIQSTYRLIFKFVRRYQTQYVDMEVQPNRDQFPVITANLCPNNCSITSLGLGKGELPGIDAQNDRGEVMVIFHDPWRVVIP